MKILFQKIVLISFSVIGLISCTKITDGTTDCDKFKKIKIIATKKSFYAGEDITLSLVSPDLSNVQYEWHVPGEVNAIYSSSGLTVSSCSKYNSGVIYLNAYSNDCGAVHDSVNITVTNKPVTAPCTTFIDSIRFSTIPSTSYTATKSYDLSFNKEKLEGSSVRGWYYPSFRVMFNDYWTGKEPEDGIYVTSAYETLTNIPSVYSVHVSSLYNSIYYSSKDYDTVYVSHVNNKLSISFCNVNLSGSDGSTTFRTTAKGNLKEN